MAITGSDLGTALGINALVCVIALLVFSVMRVNRVARKFYAPKRYDPEVKKKPRRLPLGLVGWIRPVLFYPEEEVISLAGMDVTVFLRLLSYGWVLFAFLTFWCCVLIMPVNGTGGFLYSAQGQAEANQQAAAQNKTTGLDGSSASGGDNAPLFSDLDLLSTSNIEPRSPRFVLHVISIYVIGLFAMGLLWSWSVGISKLRAKYIASLPRGGTSHTVLVTDVPGVEYGTVKGRAKIVTKPVPKALQKQATGVVGHLADGVAGTAGAAANTAAGKYVKPDWLVAEEAAVPPELEEQVLDPWSHACATLKVGQPLEAFVDGEFRDVYGDAHVAATNVVYDTANLEPLLNKYEATKQTLTDITDDYVGKIRRKKPIKKRRTVTLRPLFADKWTKETYGLTETKTVDALDFYSAKLNSIKQQIDAEAVRTRETRLPAAFVTFNDRYTQTLCATGMHSYDEQCWRSQAAPGSDEIIWGNLGLRHWEKSLRNTAMWGLFVAIVIFYLPVTAVIQAVVNLDNVKKVPGLGKITDIPFVTQILKGILPGLVLKIFLIILPPILNLMHRFAGAVSISQMDFMTVDKFFIFQVFATFLFTFFTGSALSQLSAILDNPSSLVNLLGISAPQQASFFITFIMLGALGAGMTLLKVVPLIIFLVRSKIAGTEKARYRLWADQEFMFGTYTANHTITILLGLAFCILSPLITPFCLLYFTLAIMAEKYQMIYVLKHKYEASGRMWINMFHQIMVGLYFMVAMTILVLMVKKFFWVWFAIPMPIIMGWFHSVTINLFRRPWTLMSLKEAAVLDRADGDRKVSAEEAEEIRKMYLHPAFRVDEKEHAQALTDAKAVDAALTSGADSVDVADVEPGRFESAQEETVLPTSTKDAALV